MKNHNLDTGPGRLYRLRKKIESIMKSDRRESDRLLKCVLHNVAVVYQSIVTLRVKLFTLGIFAVRKLPCKVVSIGNLTVGGVGKTPMTIKIAELFRENGYRIVILSRGYKGRAEHAGGIVSDGKAVMLDASEAGDEPYMMAKRLKNIPVVVGANRYESGMTALRYFKPDIILLDDAFQHLKLHRDANLLLLNAERPFGNRHFVPRGELREPVSSVSRADFIVLTRSEKLTPESSKQIQKISRRRPVIRTFHCPSIRKWIHNDSSREVDVNPDHLRNRKAVVFSALANNHDFLQTIKSFGCVIAGFFDFPDHHAYTDADFRLIEKSAQKSQAELIITTEKDEVKLPNPSPFSKNLVIIGIDIVFDSPASEQRFFNLIRNQLADH